MLTITRRGRRRARLFARILAVSLAFPFVAASGAVWAQAPSGTGSESQTPTLSGSPTLESTAPVTPPPPVPPWPGPGRYVDQERRGHPGGSAESQARSDTVHHEHVYADLGVLVRAHHHDRVLSVDDLLRRRRARHHLAPHRHHRQHLDL